MSTATHQGNWWKHVTSSQGPSETLGGFVSKVPQELEQELCGSIFQKCVRLSGFCVKSTTGFFFSFKSVCHSKPWAPTHLGVLENYLFLYSALSNPFLAILALSLRKKTCFYILSVMGLECLFQNSFLLLLSWSCV